MTRGAYVVIELHHLLWPLQGLMLGVGADGGRGTDGECGVMVGRVRGGVGCCRVLCDVVGGALCEH